MVDIDGIQIIAGILCAVCHMGVAIFRHKKFNVVIAGIAFLAGAGIVAGCEIIYVAYTGDLDSLPSAWRLYLSVAGVVCLGFSIERLIDVIAKPKPSKNTRQRKPKPPLNG